MKLLFLILCFVLIFSSSALAENTKYKQLLQMDLTEMLKVEVATGTSKQLSEVPAVVSVVTADEIKATGALTLAEAIERVPGLHVIPSEFRLHDTYAIRGVHSTTTPQVLILIDGVSIAEMASFAAPVSFQYPTTNIERIEIIRGPGSAVFGADAMSGVINVITKRFSNIDEAQGGIKVGSFNYRESWFNGFVTLDELKLGLSYTAESTGNDKNRVTQYGVMKRDRDLTNLHFNAKYRNFEFINWYWHIKQYMGVGAGLVGNDIDFDTSELIKSQLKWEGNLGTNWTAGADIAFTSSELNANFQLLPPGTWPIGDDGNIFAPPFTPFDFPDGVIGRPSGTTKKTTANSSFIYSGKNGHRVRVGFGIEDQTLTDVSETKNFGPGILDTINRPSNGVSNRVIDVTGTPNIYTPHYQRDLWYLSIQDEWQIAERLELTAGIRLDNYSDFGSTVNPRLAAVWSYSSELTAKVLYGSAFRAPKVSELAYINNPANLGNPDIKPEKLSMFEVVLDYRPSSTWSLQSNLFTYETEDLIQLDQSFTNQNIGQQDGHGIEIESVWRVNRDLNVTVNGSWLEAELPLTNEDKAQVPGFTAYAELFYRLSENWHVSGQAYVIADRKRQMGDDRAKVDDYHKIDVTLNWSSEYGVGLQAGVKNLLDERIIEPTPASGLFALGLGFANDYPMESRNTFVAVTYDF